MLIALTAACALGALVLAGLAAQYASFRLGFFSALCSLAAFLGMLFLNLAWEWMLLCALVLLSGSLLIRRAPK